MKINLLRQKNEQTLNSIVDSTTDSHLSPNLFPKTQFIENEVLIQSKKKTILVIKIVVLILLLAYITSTLILRKNVYSTYQLANQLDNKVDELGKYSEEAVKINKTNRRINIHKEISTKHATTSKKITDILKHIQTDNNLLSFDFKDNILTFEIARENVLEVSDLLDKILSEKFVNEVAILEANLNSFDNMYVLKMEVTFKE